MEVRRESVEVSRELLEVQRVSATFISATYSKDEDAKADVKKMLTLDNPPHIKIWLFLFFYLFSILLQIFPRCYIPIFDGLVLWSYNFAKVWKSFPSLFKTLPQSEDCKLQKHKKIFPHQHFKLNSRHNAVSSNAGWFQWWNCGQLFAARGLLHYFIMWGVKNPYQK